VRLLNGAPLTVQTLSTGVCSCFQVLERESGRAFEAEGSGMANELCTIVEDADDLARITSGMSRVGVSCEDERQLVSLPHTHCGRSNAAALAVPLSTSCGWPCRRSPAMGRSMLLLPRA
jgi:hypothetical protein